MKEVTVTATQDALAERHAAVAQKTVIDRKEIEALGGLTIGEVIGKLPGIDAGQHGGDGSPSANARGMGRDAVQILVDGERPAANSRYALTMVGRQPTGELERIEILRGASAEHGGGAPVTVNLVMRKARPRESMTLRAAAGMRGDEPNGQFTASRGGGEGGFSWLLPVTVNHHGMPLEKQAARTSATASGTLNHNERESSPYTLDEFILSPRFTWKNSDANLTLWPSYYRNRGERNGELARSASSGAGVPLTGERSDREESDMHIARLRAEGEKRLAGGGKLSGRAAVMAGQRDTDTARIWRETGSAPSAAREKNRRDENEFNAALRFDRPSGEALLSLGLEHAHFRRDERQEHSGAYQGDGIFATREAQWTAWAQHEWQPREALTLTAGARGESIRLESGGAARRSGLLAPSLAARLEPIAGWVLRASAGGGIKAPKLDEISGLTVRNPNPNSPLEADRGGNPELRPERTANLEAVLERHLPKDAGVLGANLYLRRTTDFIERRAMLEDGRWVERSHNEGEARHWGLELDAKLKAVQSFLGKGSLRAHLTLPKSRVEDVRLGLTRAARESPRYQFTLGYEQALPAWSASAGFQLQQYGRIRSAVPGELETATRARTLLDAHLVRRLTPALNLRLSAQNLLREDTRRASSAYAASDAWALATGERGQRTWLVSLEGKW